MPSGIIANRRRSAPEVEVRIIPSCPGYGATEDGRIWSFKTQRYRKTHPIKNRYLMVTLRVHGKTVRRYAHRLVGEAWIPNPENLSDIDHIDGSRDGNRVGNLRWTTRSQNLLYAKARGVRLGVGNLRLSDACVLAIRRDSRPRKFIAAQYGITVAYVTELRIRRKRA